MADCLGGSISPLSIRLRPLTLEITLTIQPDNTIFGLGKISIQVHVKYAEDWNGTGFVFGPFVIRIAPL